MVWDCIVLTVLFMNGAILSSSRGDYVRLGGLLFFNFDDTEECHV